MNVIILSAGLATRMPDAPYGNKSLVDFAGRPAIAWQLDALPESHVQLVVRPAAARAFREFPVEVVVHDDANGPHNALASCELHHPTLVVFSDTLFDEVPERRDEAWVGVNVAKGGRTWEYAGPDGFVKRRHVPVARHLAVHVGMYWFTDPARLRKAIAESSAWHHMLNRYVFHRDELVPGWLDIGDMEALEIAERELVG